MTVKIYRISNCAICPNFKLYSHSGWPKCMITETSFLVDEGCSGASPWYTAILPDCPLDDLSIVRAVHPTVIRGDNSV
jgi:hypothetical protein